MTDTTDALLPPEENLPAPPDTSAGTWDIMGAAWQAETIRTDAWNYAQHKRRDLSRSMYDMLRPEAKMRIQARRWDYENNWIDFEDMVLDEVSREVPTNPTKYGTLPLSREQFDLRIDAERRKELDEAQTILDQPGGGFAEFVGASARAVTDQTSLMLMPFGASGSFLRSVGAGALLEAAGEAAVLPREFEVAKELDLPTPDVTSRILLGAALGGGLAAGLHGLAKGAGMILAHRNALRDAKPTDMDSLDFEAAVDAAEGQLRGDTTVQETIGLSRDSRIDTAAGPLEFDYRAGGNASPRTNRVGYVFGRLTDLGYPPHVAAALVGNLMQESGPAINTRAVGDNGNAFGMGQWNGPRRMAYLAYANKRNVDPGDLDTQIAFLDHEMRTTERAARDRIMATSDAREAAAVASEAFWRPGVPHTERRMAYADAVMRQFDNGNVPKWDGVAVVLDGPTEFTGYSTSRGYTGAGQVTAGDEFRIDVDYEVMDLTLLRRATGDFQPRDRSRVASDAWIADTAARLDPAQLMPSPTADRGTPIVGPDGMIESGNGRAAAIGRAYEQHPERAAAYRAQIEAAGYAIPEGMERPVLIARRKTDLTDDELQRFTVAAQDSGVAAMTPTEVARASSRAMTAPVLQRLQPGQPLNAVENGDFVKAALAGLPRSARNAMFGEGGVLNAEGLRRLREALFARAWPDPDIIARFAETDAGPLKSLMEALDRAAPAWAALRAEIEAGRVRPEMDISGFVLDAMRLIGAARDLAGREGLSIARALDELLNEVDLLEGAVSPLTTALVRKFWRDGRAAPADQVASFLTRYAEDARKAGVTGALFDGPTPRDVLQAIDPEGFADLPEDLGTPRGFARRAPREAVPVAEEGYDAGAGSPEAEEADAEIAADLETPFVTYDLAEVERTFDLVQIVDPFKSGLSVPSLALMQRAGADRALRISATEWALVRPKGMSADAIRNAPLLPPGGNAATRPAAAPPDTATLLKDVPPERFVSSLADAQPFDDLPTLYSLAEDAQARLAEAGARISTDLGITFRNPGLKDRATTEEKIRRKGYRSPRRLTDVSRGAFIVTDPGQADRLVDRLAQDFDLVDEGWKQKPEGYVDRKVIIRHDGGLLSEVQILTEAMFAAKEIGTPLYTRARSMPDGSPDRARLIEEQKAVYSAAADDALRAVAFSADGTSSAPKLLANQRLNASSDASTLAVWNTSKASTGTQSSPGSSTASAKSDPDGLRYSTAGRASQSVNASNVMGAVPPSGQDTPNMVGAAREVNPPTGLDAFGSFEIDMPDGTRRTVAEVLDDLSNDTGFDAFIQACAVSGGAQ